MFSGSKDKQLELWDSLDNSINSLSKASETVVLNGYLFKLHLQVLSVSLMGAELISPYPAVLGIEWGLTLGWVHPVYYTDPVT